MRSEKCYNCGHEKVEWMPFKEVEGKMYCGMCLSLGLQCLKYHEELKNKGFEIITTDTEEYKCKTCGHLASKDLPVYTLKEHNFCVVCLLLAIKFLDEKLEKDVKTAKWLNQREN